MLVVGTRNVQVAAANIINSLIIDKECAIRVLNGAVCGENSVIWFNHGCGHTRRWVDGELKLGLLAIVGREALKKQSTKAGASTTAEGVEDQEALKRRAVVCGMLE